MFFTPIFVFCWCIGGNTSLWEINFISIKANALIIDNISHSLLYQYFLSCYVIIMDWNSYVELLKRNMRIWRKIYRFYSKLNNVGQYSLVCIHLQYECSLLARTRINIDLNQFHILI